MVTVKPADGRSERKKSHLKKNVDVHRSKRERAAHESEPSTTALCTELPAISNPILSEEKKKPCCLLGCYICTYARYNTMKFVGIGEERSLHMKFFIHFFFLLLSPRSFPSTFFSSLLLSFFFLRRVFLLEHSLSFAHCCCRRPSSYSI